MKNICVVTGGGSGMGLATAKIMGKSHYIILVGRTPQKLEGALAELKAMGIEGEIMPGDVGVRDSMRTLAEHAAALGTARCRDVPPHGQRRGNFQCQCHRHHPHQRGICKGHGPGQLHP